VVKGEVALTVGKERFQAKLSGDYNFGEQRLEFAIPEVPRRTSALVTLVVNEKTRNFPVSIEPKRKWTVYLVPNIHLDVGFTDYQAKVGEVHCRDIDKLVKEIYEYPETRFSLDGSWIVDQYFSTRTAVAQKQFIDLVREGKISVPIQYANVHTGNPTLETLIRSTDFTARLHREHGLPFNYANITDIPNYGWSYPSILRALGVKYLAAAANTWRSAFLPYSRWNEKSPFWWQGPDGNKVLMAYTRQYSQLSFICGLPARVPSCRQSLPTFLQAFESPDYKPNIALMYGTQVENTDIIPGVSAFIKKWNSQYAYPKLVLATFPDYFRKVERQFGSSLETVVGDGGPSWEDGVGTDALYTAIDRLNQHRATSAEKLATIATYLNPSLAAPRELIRRMWTDITLFNEHTWSSVIGYTRPESEQTVRQEATKRLFAIQARESLTTITEHSLSQLAHQIHLPSTALVVFNPMNWTRSDLVELDLDSNRTILEYPGLTPVPLEILRQDEEYSRVRFLAKDVPSLGYKCYQVVSRRGGSPPREETLMLGGTTIENRFYRVEVDPATGGVRSLFDKQLNRELVDAVSPYRLNQYLYVAGGDETDTQLIIFRKTLPLATLTVTPSGAAQISSVRKTPYGQILTLRTSGVHAPSIETDIILYDDEKKIEFVNRVHKEPVRNKEAVYFAFPFALEKPSFSYEIQNGWVDPSRDLLKGANLEWFTVQHWLKVAGPDVAIGLVPIDAPLVTLGDINRGTWPEKFEPPSSTVFSYVINNYWDTNYPRIQGGEYTFRYALTSGRDLPPEFLSRFGRDSVVPLELGWVLHTDKYDNPPAPLEPSPTSFLQLNTDNVIVENWKAAEDGQGTILRLLEVGGRSNVVRLTFPRFTLSRAWLANALEENMEELEVTRNSLDVAIKPHEILTLRVIAMR
jgi:alpha-mannosidase